MKICKDCKKKKIETDFYGVQGECKECTKSRVSINYRKNIEYYKNFDRERNKTIERKKKQAEYTANARKKYKQKYRARNAVNNAIRNGKLIKLACEICGDIKSDGHHEDYRKKLQVRWLCRKHHHETHQKKL